MKKTIILITTVLLLQTQVFAQGYDSNGPAASNPDVQDYSNGPAAGNPDVEDSNGPASDNPETTDEVAQEICSSLEVRFGYKPGSLRCKRNFSSCTKVPDTITKVACNFTIEPIGNTLKIPLNMMEEAAFYAAQGASEEVENDLPIIGPALRGAFGLLAGLGKGLMEGLIGTGISLFEISGDANKAVLKVEYDSDLY
ncbi:MAG: hypothetical protein ISR65_12560 [Bacteriovoracaceae bacterium]|nr:hypothetical protein [Bacteriovoracaceae bacterium]